MTLIPTLAFLLAFLPHPLISFLKGFCKVPNTENIGFYRLRTRQVLNEFVKFSSDHGSFLLESEILHPFYLDVNVSYASLVNIFTQLEDRSSSLVPSFPSVPVRVKRGVLTNLLVSVLIIIV